MSQASTRVDLNQRFDRAHSSININQVKMSINFRSVAQNEGTKLIIFVPWFVCNAVMLYFAYQKYCVGPQFFYLRRILGASMCISRSTAFMLNFNCFIILLPICKSLLTWIRMRIQKYVKGVHRRLLNPNLKFHYVVGISIIILSSIHTLSHCVNCYRFYFRFSEENPELNISPKKEKISIVLFLSKLPVYSGIAMVLILAILLICSLPPIRRSHYEIFWYSHHLSILFYGFLIVHGFGGIVKYQVNMDEHHPGCEFTLSKNISTSGRRCEGRPQFAPDPPQAWKWVAIPLLLYAIEKIMRYFSARKPVQVTKAVFHPGHILEIRMKKEGFSALPGQFIRLNCKDIATMEWHPFTLTQCPNFDDDEFSVHIKVTGDWTDLLASQLRGMIVVNKHANCIGESWTIPIEDLQQDSVAVAVEALVVRLQVDGPYGSPFQDVSRFRVAIIITAGIGVTPFAAVLNRMRYVIQTSQSYGKLTKLYFVWVCKTHDDMSWFIDVLYQTNTLINSTFDRPMMEASLFLTRSKAPSDVDPSLFDEKRKWLNERLTYKRPNWNEQLDKIDSLYQRERIGVFYCGPKNIHPILHTLCNRTTTNKNTFIFHKENF